MFSFKTSRSAVIGLTLALTVLFLAKAAPDAEATKLGANAPAIPSYEFTTPLFGLAVAPDGSLLVADAGAGVVELRREGHLVAELPGVTDISPIGRGNMFATTGAGPGEDARKLFRVARGGVKEIE